MCKVIGFKAIIKNMVDSEIRDLVYKRAKKFANVDSIELNLDNEELGLPQFVAEIKVDYNTYRVGGYIGEYGNVQICSVYYNRMVCQEKDEHGDWIMDSAKPVSRFVYGDALDSFMFDR